MMCIFLKICGFLKVECKNSNNNDKCKLKFTLIKKEKRVHIQNFKMYILINYFFLQLTTDCIPMQRNGDVRPNSEAIVPFPAARIEAERALQEKNRQNLSNRYIELFMA